MGRSAVAALMSALIFPGAGQWFLGRWKRACLFAVPAAVAVFILIGSMLAAAEGVVSAAEARGAALDPFALAAQLEAQDMSGTAKLCAGVLVACWLAAIADAWLCGRNKLPS